VHVFPGFFFVPDEENNYSLEKYGVDSMCFEHGSVWTVQHCQHTYPVEHWGSGCYQVILELILYVRKSVSS